MISAYSAPPVAMALASSASPTFPPDSRSAMMPEPTTAASSSAVPKASATTGRRFIAAGAQPQQVFADSAILSAVGPQHAPASCSFGADVP